MSTSTIGVGNFTGGAGRFEARDSRHGNVCLHWRYSIYSC